MPWLPLAILLIAALTAAALALILFPPGEEGDEIAPEAEQDEAMPGDTDDLEEPRADPGETPAADDPLPPTP